VEVLNSNPRGRIGSPKFLRKQGSKRASPIVSCPFMTAPVLLKQPIHLLDNDAL